MNSTLLYFLPLLVALAFVVAHLARGSKPSLRATPVHQVVLGVAAVIALAAAGVLVSHVALR